MRIPRPHARRAIAIARAACEDGVLSTEHTIPESEFALDMLAVMGRLRAAWGCVRNDLQYRPVLIEHCARPPSPFELATSWIKLAWAHFEWQKGRWPTLRGPLLLVLSVGRPSKALAAFGELRPDPAEGAIYRTAQGVALEALLVDVRHLPDRPGTRLLRSFDHRLEVTAQNVQRLLHDPQVDTLTKERIVDAIVRNKTLFDPKLYELTYEELLEKGRQRGREEGRHKGREEGRQEGREEGHREALLDVARTVLDKQAVTELEGVDDLAELRQRVNALLRQRR